MKHKFGSKWVLKRKEILVLFAVIVFFGIAFAIAGFFVLNYISKKDCLDFITKSLPSIEARYVKDFNCEHKEPQFPDPSSQCTFKISKDNIDIANFNIDLKSPEECNSLDFELRKQGSIIICGELRNGYENNNYDISQIVIRELDGEYSVYISSFDY